MDLVLAKIGGSVITRKDQFCTANEKAISRLAKEISRAMKEKSFKLALVHGAGSFGHMPVKKFGLQNGALSEKHFFGVAATQWHCRQLNQLLVKALLDEGVVAVSIEGFATNRVEIGKETVAATVEALRKNMVPVLFGQMAFDGEKGALPFSGDRKIALLATALKPRRIVFGTDVDGIFDADPKIIKKAKLIKKLELKNLYEIVKKVGESRNDVSGGMRGKVMELSKLEATKIIVVNALEPKRFEKALLGQKTLGTIVE